MYNKKDLISLGEIIDSSELDPVTMRYYKCLEDRKIIINEEIGDFLLEKAIIPLLEMDNDGSGKPISIYLSTPGGSVYSGFALIDVIEKLKTPTEIRLFSMAASMGTLIAMAGHNNPNVKCVCYPFTVALVHSGTSFLEGSASAVRDTFHFNERYEERIKKYILSHSTIDEDTYSKIERQEFWMDSDDMLKFGIVQEII